MRFMKRRWMPPLGLAALAVTAGIVTAAVASAQDDAKADPAVEEARAKVKMLDELYKTAVVSITEKYPRGTPAIMVAKDIFKVMEDGKYHSAKLVDATGSPLGTDTDPQTDFEKKAARAMLDGETYLDEVVGEGADRRLLAATVVPAVLPRCASCHGVETGDLLGFIRYDVPIEP